MKWLLFAVFFVLSLALSAQQEEDERTAVDQLIELLSERAEVEDFDLTTLLEDLNYFIDHPLDLNTASREELERLLILDDFQITNLLDHRERAGRLLMIYELQGIQGFDVPSIRSILPFVSAGGGVRNYRPSFKSMIEEGSSEAFLRLSRTLEPMAGYADISEEAYAENPNSRYLGSPDRLLLRYRYKALDYVSIGFTAEKDPGEQLFRETQAQGFDFYSGHISIGNYGKLKRLIIGDFHAQFGQGLTYWTGLAFGKTVDMSSVKRNGRGVRPYLSSDENNFMRGGAATFELGRLEVTGFVSSKRVDANRIIPDTIGEGEPGVIAFSSFQASGFHRTPSELEDKDAIRETNVGSHIRYNGKRFSVGATGVTTNYNGEYSRNLQLYNQFEDTSSAFVVGGVDYQLALSNIHLFGEVSEGRRGGAFIQGALVSLDPRLDVSLVYRQFDKSYFSPRSNAFGESTTTRNESGLFMGWNAKVHRQFTFRGFYDVFRFPWLRFQVDAPSTGYEFLSQLDYRRSRQFSAYVRYRSEVKPRNSNEEGFLTSQIIDQRRQWFRIHTAYKLNKAWTLKNRIEYLRINRKDSLFEEGIILYQDVAYKAFGTPISFKLRYALFQTDSYNSRLYAYEDDVLYSFSVPAYFYRGSRYYLFVKWRINRYADLSGRFSRTFFSNQDGSSSGLNRIEGRTRTDLRLQLRVKF